VALTELTKKEVRCSVAGAAKELHGGEGVLLHLVHVLGPHRKRIFIGKNQPRIECRRPNNFSRSFFSHVSCLIILAVFFSFI